MKWLIISLMLMNLGFAKEVETECEGMNQERTKNLKLVKEDASKKKRKVTSQ